jgi:hypothetical protein
VPRATFAKAPVRKSPFVRANPRFVASWLFERTRGATMLE